MTNLEDEGNGVLNVGGQNSHPQDVGPGSDQYWIDLQEEQKDVVYRKYRSDNGIKTPWDEGERQHAFYLWRGR